MSKASEYFAQNWQKLIMGPSSGKNAFHQFEEKDEEISAVDGALNALVDLGMLEHSKYDYQSYDYFSDSVQVNFQIPWTGISPRMRRLVYAINAIRQPNSTVCAGIFCGYTFICNAGSAIGAGAVYTAENLVGIEILAQEAALAKNNVDRFSPGNGNMIICADASIWLSEDCNFAIDLLYIDAKAIEFDPKNPSNGPANEDSEYLKIVEKAYSKLSPNALVLAHNSVNAASSIGDYLNYVRSNKFKTSLNVFIDDAGLEVSLY